MKMVASFIFSSSFERIRERLVTGDCNSQHTIVSVNPWNCVSSFFTLLVGGPTLNLTSLPQELSSFRFCFN